jgi:hypothetical protein
MLLLPVPTLPRMPPRTLWKKTRSNPLSCRDVLKSRRLAGGFFFRRTRDSKNAWEVHHSTKAEPVPASAGSCTTACEGSRSSPHRPEMTMNTKLLVLLAAGVLAISACQNDTATAEQHGSEAATAADQAASEAADAASAAGNAVAEGADAAAAAAGEAAAVASQAVDTAADKAMDAAGKATDAAARATVDAARDAADKAASAAAQATADAARNVADKAQRAADEVKAEEKE